MRTAVAEKLIAKMTDVVFKGVHVKPAGRAYSALCSVFPLEEIKIKSEHKAALDVATRLIDYLHTESEEIKEFSSEIESYLGALSTLIEKYEQETFPEIGKVSAAQVVAYLLESQGLKQSDIAEELGGQSVVSDVLNEKRELNLRQVRALAERFHISPAVFI